MKKSCSNHISLRNIGAVSGLLTVSVLLAGCSKVAQQVQNTVSNTVQQVAGKLATEADFAKISDPLVRKNFVAQANTRAFKTVMTSSEKMAGTTTTEVQISGSTMAMHTTMQIAGKNQEMIIMGDTTYVKDPADGSWWKQVATVTDASPTPGKFKVPTVDEAKQQLADKQNTAIFKAEGTEACGSLTCYKYLETDNGDGTSAKTIWFDNQQFLTRKDVQTMGSSTVTNTYSYDNVSVTAPSPTKDVPAGHSAFEYLMGAPTSDAGSIPAGSLPTGSIPAAAANPGTGKVPTQAEIDAMIKQAQQAGGQSGQ